MAPVTTLKTFSADSAFPQNTKGLLRLYSMRFCPYAQRTRLVLAHKNIKYETVNVDLKKKPEWFLSKAPLGLVPVVELDDQIVFESTAASEWLDDIYPENKLQPTDPYMKARDRILLEYFGKLVTVMSGIRMKSLPDHEKGVKDLLKHFKFYDDALSERGSRYFGGDNPAMIDFYLWPHFERVPPLLTVAEARAVITKDVFPNLAGWFDTMYETPAVKSTMFDAASHQQFVNSYYSENAKPGFDFGLEQ